MITGRIVSCLARSHVHLSGPAAVALGAGLLDVPRSTLHRVLWPSGARLATTAEEYDLIAEEKGLARIDGYAEHGFIVNNDNVQGPIMCVRTLCVTWNVARLEDVTLESLALLDVVKPAPELLVLGCGRTIQRLPPELVRGLAAKGVSVEASDTPNAVATFNILNQEGRAVAAAMLPLEG